MHLPELATATAMLTIVSTNAPISPWISRKILHMGVGTLLLNADLSDSQVVSGIYTTSAAVCGLVTVDGMKLVSDQRKTDGFVKDLGIFSYAISCFFCLALSVPYSEMAPLFYADPSGAIIGRTIKSAQIYNNKTLAGSTAVFGTTFITLPYSYQLHERIVISTFITVIELLGGDIDNLLISLFLMSKYCMFTNCLFTF
tara:strand:- start:2432 stop:3028 length:597 start_codon:yes stop_codon:yes gene_type:complete